LIGGRRLPVKKVGIAPVLMQQAMVEATATQLRVIAEESKELLIDKIMAGPPARGTERVEDRPARTAARRDLDVEDRRAFRHPPLADRTVARKRHHHLDGRRLVETGHYVNNIEVKRGFQKDSGVNYLVRPRPIQHRGFSEQSGPITLKQLARTLELGSARHNIPARPHWGPVIRATIRRFNRAPDDIKAEALRIALRNLR
jgi:hypothetical protein